ncbi:hypothetical protein RJ639_042786 [Escallonia herrerae]|uniref:Reverse transcriptase Ty1/copia-type domain-containing protein n=1 Tax=Escallonia herrerae TaxID=1293975 RepID=A0AA88WF31_9ASTE|nr:hypothetical protein RJ639_042786 [Escallonia herrerae]
MVVHRKPQGFGNSSLKGRNNIPSRKPTILFVVIVVKQGIRNNDAMRLSDIQSGGISQGSQEKTLSAKQRQWSRKGISDQPRRKNHNLLPTWLNQGILTRKTLGYGVKRDKLYYLELSRIWETKNFHKGYRCYDPQNKKLHVTLDVSFRETEPYYIGGEGDEDALEEPVLTPSTEEFSQNVQDDAAPQVTLDLPSNELDLLDSYALAVDQLSKVSIPSSVQEVLADLRWTKEMNEDMEALKKNSTWELVPLLEGKKIVGCKWMYTVKVKADGSIDRYKTRLVAKGYTQKYGDDYQETFTLVAKLNIIRILISVAMNRDWSLRQFDVKYAFLNGDLEEVVYMELPPDVEHGSTHKGNIRKLKRLLYGLKQPPRVWFGRFTSIMKSVGYRQSNSDHILFIKHKGGKATTLVVYVDDMVLTGNDPEEMERLHNYLASKFEKKDLGQLRYFLGIEVSWSRQGIYLSQRKYVLDLLTEIGMLTCKRVETPMEINHELGTSSSQSLVDVGRYERLVGKLIYLTHTRMDIAYAVSMVSQFMRAPSEKHMNAIYRILRYLKGSLRKGLLYSKYEASTIEGYTDADWAGDQLNRKSTLGYLTFVEGNLVTWRSKKQKVVTWSSAEVEFQSMAYGLCELLWIKRVLKDLGI